MRTSDPTEPEPFKPFGEKVKKPEPAPKPASAPRGEYGVVTMPDGTVRTTRDNLPPNFGIPEGYWRTYGLKP